MSPEKKKADCKHARKNFMDFYFGELSDTAKAEFSKHIEQCEDCALLYRSFSLSMNSITESRQKPAPFFYTRLQQRLATNTESKVPAPSIFTQIARPVLLAAMVVIGVFIGWGVSSLIDQKYTDGSSSLNESDPLISLVAEDYKLDAGQDEKMEIYYINE